MNRRCRGRLPPAPPQLDLRRSKRRYVPLITMFLLAPSEPAAPGTAKVRTALSLTPSMSLIVPLFNDKHFSYRWDWAQEMYDTAREHGMPLMAGSSVPLGQRLPLLESPAGAEIETALSVHGGGVVGTCAGIIFPPVSARDASGDGEPR